MSVSTKVQSIVRAALKRRFPNMRVVRVNVEKTFGHLGDPILEIRVVFDDKNSRFISGNLVEIPGLLIPELAKMKIEAFPILSYVAKSEFEAVSPEAA
jgi:hypothetical protein